MKENKYIEEITKKLRVKAPDEALYEVSWNILKEYEEAKKEETKKELERFEGILWARYKQLRKWEKIIRKGCDREETRNLIKRRKNCLIEIRVIQKSF